VDDVEGIEAGVGLTDVTEQAEQQQRRSQGP
jgi:hypothetical protein